MSLPLLCVSCMRDMSGFYCKHCPMYDSLQGFLARRSQDGGEYAGTGWELAMKELTTVYIILYILSSDRRKEDREMIRSNFPLMFYMHDCSCQTDPINNAYENDIYILIVG